jgi:hypothetical protein
MNISEIRTRCEAATDVLDDAAGTGLEFRRCTYGPCARRRFALAVARSGLTATLEASEEAKKIADILRPTMNLGVVQAPTPIEDTDRLFALKDAIGAFDAILGESE